jgi:hypothetical protein
LHGIAIKIADLFYFTVCQQKKTCTNIECGSNYRVTLGKLSTISVKTNLSVNKDSLTTSILIKS